METLLAVLIALAITVLLGCVIVLPKVLGAERKERTAAELARQARPGALIVPAYTSTEARYGLIALGIRDRPLPPHAGGRGYALVADARSIGLWDAHGLVVEFDWSDVDVDLASGAFGVRSYPAVGLAVDELETPLPVLVALPGRWQLVPAGAETVHRVLDELLEVGGTQPGGGTQA